MLLVDTNVWLAAADRRARRHEACLALVNANRGGLASTAPVIAETAWLLLDRDGPNAQQQFIGSILTGDIGVIDLTAADWARVYELIATYADASIDIIDASTIAVTERGKAGTAGASRHSRVKANPPGSCTQASFQPEMFLPVPHDWRHA